MPWSTPYTWPSGIGMMWPPLRSALLTTASNTAIRRSAGSSRPHERRRGRRPGRRRSTAAPCPGRTGPSRSTVGGTTRQPVASDDQVAPRSPGRPACRRGSPTAAAPPPPACRRTRRPGSPLRIVPTSVTLLASSRRPSRSISPSRSSCSASASSAGARSAGLDGLLAHGRRRRSAAVAVLPRADVPGRVERQRAQRARRAAGGDDAAGSGDERPGGHRGDASRAARRGPRRCRRGWPPRRWARRWRRRPPRRRPRRRRPRPGPWPRPGTPRRPARSSGSRSSTSASGGIDRVRAAGHLVEELVHAVGEDLHLRLLQRDADRAAAVVGGLQVEGAVPGLAHGAGDEPGRAFEEMDLTGHAPRLRGRADRSPRRHRGTDAVQTSCRLRRRRRRRRTALRGGASGGGSSAETSPPVSLTRTTKGRVSV